MEYFAKSKNTFLHCEEDNLPMMIPRTKSDETLKTSCDLLKDPSPIYRVEHKQDSDRVSFSSVQTAATQSQFMVESYVTGQRLSIETISTPTARDSTASLPARFTPGSRTSTSSMRDFRQSTSSLSCWTETFELGVEATIEELADERPMEENEKTTVMIRNIPCRYSQDELLDEITMLDLPFNFLYLPPARHSPGNLGYAFVNFVEPAHAALFIQIFSGHAFACQPKSKKRAVPCFAVLQGFQPNVAFYSTMKVSKSKYRPFIDAELAPADWIPRDC
jgi:hypothetical protein